MTVVGVDVATAGVRAFAVGDDGSVRATASRPLPAPVRDESGRSEQDARSWWPAVEAVLQEVTASVPEPVRAVAVSATSGTIVAVDRRGEPLGPALMYDDRRGADDNVKAAEAGAPRWRELGMSVSPTAALGRITWLRRACPDAAGIRHTPDLIGEQLLGRPVATDSSHALKSGYDPLREEWAAEVFDFDVAWLPQVVRPTTVLGELPRAVAGLPAGCLVVAGMTDGCAGQLATGAVTPGSFAGILGTTYVLKGVTEQLVRDTSGALYSHRHPDGWWLPGGASNTGGEAVSGVAGLAAMDSAAAKRGPARVVAYPLKRSGERFPFVTPEARGFVLGEPADEVELHRARLEGVAFVERLALERLQGLGVPVTGPLVAAGGGSRSPLWTRIRATVTGMELRVSPQAETGYGAALLAAAAVLPGGLTEAAGMISDEGQLIEPDPSEVEALEHSYQRFTEELKSRGWI
ncbi:FGGY-family carbohydrate kinase [Amycolatopsis thermophila]|uniref:Sugar (Pentulose or hexulose) kinase n=1 Tax=Amycolatopsis thermophila TaxID=206084 RepID=A0ABU0ETZ5_9PSEU|nr:FGGY-family carbohydrate kinase [Amycolatopsis thermophila]MDQ0378783.1 sugar (pentulose or hexulose) kinase [Amycolatopsis thermophila]